MKEAVIVSTARTGIGRAFKVVLDGTKSPTMMGHAIKHAVDRAGIDPARIDDAAIGTVLASGTAGRNLARNAVFASGLPTSGLMAMATAAKQIMVDGMQIVIAGGQENISAVQALYFDAVMKATDPNVTTQVEHAYMPMLKTAEFVADTYGISRDAQDEYALSSQQRNAAAQEAGGFDAEIVPFSTQTAVKDCESGKVTMHDITLDRDEGNRPSATLSSLQGLNPVIEGGGVTAGNASQLSDGASALVLMEGAVVARHGAEPLGIHRGVAVAAIKGAASNRDRSNVTLKELQGTGRSNVGGSRLDASQLLSEAPGMLEILRLSGHWSARCRNALKK